MGKRCLVTGGTGFIGFNLTKKLLDDGFDVVITGKQGENYEDVKNLVVGYDLFSLDWNKIGDIDVLYHQAAIVDTTVMDREEMLRINVEGSKVVFENAVKHGCKHIVYASSTATYGNEPAPYVEGITALKPLNPYGESKKLLDEFAMHFAEKHSEITVVGLRYCNVYGSYDTHKGKMRCYLTQLAEQMMKGNPILFKYGEQKRDFVYIKDVIQANLLASKATKSCIVNCGSGIATEFNSAIKIISNVLGLDRKPKYIDNPYEGNYQNYTQCDMAYAKKMIGFIPKYNVEEGLEDLYRKSNRIVIQIFKD